MDRLARTNYGSLDDGAAIVACPTKWTKEDAYLSFHNIGYVVEKRLIRKERKVILDDVR